jgi:hypothetical protein
MFLSNRNLPPKSIPVRIVMPVKCVVTSAAMCACVKEGATAKANQIKNLDIWLRNHSSVKAAPLKI